MPVVNYKLAYAAGWDAANRNMRKHNRTVWCEEDYIVACETMNKLIKEAKRG